MSNEMNPYAPPESDRATQNAIPSSLKPTTRFGIVGGKLHCSRNVSLPEICIASGLESELVRLTTILPATSRISKWIPLILLPGVPWFTWSVIIALPAVALIRYIFMKHNEAAVGIAYSISIRALTKNRVLGATCGVLVPLGIIVSWLAGMEAESAGLIGMLVVAAAVASDYFFSNRLTVVLMGIRNRCILRGFSKSFLEAAQHRQERQATA